MNPTADPVSEAVARLHDLQQRVEATVEQAITAWDADVPGTENNCREMSSFSGAWDSGTYAVAAALRARADEIDQQSAGGEQA